MGTAEAKPAALGRILPELQAIRREAVAAGRG
jgi:hypothetical protein